MCDIPRRIKFLLLCLVETLLCCADFTFFVCLLLCVWYGWVTLVKSMQVESSSKSNRKKKVSSLSSITSSTTKQEKQFFLMLKLTKQINQRKLAKSIKIYAFTVSDLIWSRFYCFLLLQTNYTDTAVSNLYCVLIQ